MDGFANILFHAHSGLRYLVLLAGIIAFGYSLVAMLRDRPWDRPGRIMFTSFVGLVDLQVLIGILLVIVWPFYGALIGHITMMVLAAVAAHVASRINRKRPPERQSHQVAVLGTAGTLILIVGGIMAIGRPLL